MNCKKWMKALLTLVLVLLVIWVGVNYRHHINVITLKEAIISYGIWAPIIFIGLYIIATVLFLPGAIFTLVGGLLFGALWGTLYNIIGAVLGSTMAFLISRYIAADYVAQKSGPRLKKLMDGVAKEGWRFVAVVRLIPIFPYNMVNYALGLTQIGILAYMLAGAIFMLPATFAYTYVGSLGETVIHGQTRQIVTKVLIAVGLVVLVAMIPYVVKKIKKQQSVKAGIGINGDENDSI